MLLDSFTLADVAGNRARGQLLRSFQLALFYGLEAQRELQKSRILNAIHGGCRPNFAFENWARVVDQRFSNDALSPCGSLYISGRFNIGRDVSPPRFPTFPALYVASNHATAFCEKFGVEHDAKYQGLTSDELRACSGQSWSSFSVNGVVHRVLDLTDNAVPAQLCAIFARFSIPVEAMRAARMAGLGKATIVRTLPQFYKTVLANNWRAMPSQFNLPSNSQIIGQLAAEAGCEAILYPSVQYPSGMCLALLTRCIANDGTFVEISGTASTVAITRVDSTHSGLW